MERPSGYKIAEEHLGKLASRVLGSSCQPDDSQLFIFSDVHLLLQVYPSGDANFLMDESNVDRATFLRAVAACEVCSPIFLCFFLPFSCLVSPFLLTRVILQIPPGMVKDESDTGMVVHIDGNLDFAQQARKNVSLEEMQMWAQGLPVLSEWLGRSKGKEVLCSGGSLNIVFRNMDVSGLDWQADLPRRLETELGTVPGKNFLRQVGENVFKKEKGVPNPNKVELVSVLATNNSLQLPPKVKQDAPPLHGLVYLSVYRVLTGNNGSKNLCRLTAPSLKLWRNMNYQRCNFRLATLTASNELSLDRTLSKHAQRGPRASVEAQWKKRMLTLLSTQLNKMTCYPCTTTGNSLRLATMEDAAFLVLFSWDFEFHKACERELVMLWPEAERNQCGREVSFHPLPELGRGKKDEELTDIKWLW